MANQVLNDLTKLKSVLHTSGISQKNQPLHQVIWGLIEFCQKNFQGIQAGTIGPGPGSTTVNQTIQQFFLGSGEDSGDGASDNFPGPPGPPGANGMVPYYVALNETFTVPIYKQALFTMNIDNEGILDIEGFLIEVDGDFEDEAQIITLTGTQNNLVINTGTTILYCNNTTDLIITGIAGGWSGRRLTVISAGAGNVYLAHQNGGSTAGNQLTNTVTSGHTPLAAGFGKSEYEYDIATSKWKLLWHEQGAYIDIPFASCVYDSNTGAFWTVVIGDISVQRFYISGKNMIVIISINSTTTTLAGVGTRLRIDFSAFLSYTWNTTTRSFARVVDGGAAQLGMATGGAGGVSLIQFSHDVADTAWGVGAGRGMNGITLLLGLN